MKNIQPYAGLAPFYDKVMDHVDYKAWADYISMIFTTFGADIFEVVDCGCGTGNLIKRLEKRGYWVAGFDGCRNMVKIALSKTSGILWQGDLKSLALKKEWDAVICIYDTIQYLDQEDIRIFLQEVNRVLRKEGLLIFDIVTKKNIEKYWINFTGSEKINGYEVKRKSWFEKEKEILHTSFQCADQSSPTLTTEHHIQYIYDLDRYKELFDTIHWILMGSFHEFTFRPADHNSERVHFVLRKEK